MVSSLAAFEPLLRDWFMARFGAPAPIQERGWPAIGAGHHTLLCAPTGSGKTLAAFSWALDYLIGQAQNGALREEVSVLYVSPLKALANDVQLNLQQPLAEVRELAHSRGQRLAPIAVGLRTGDTPASLRGAMLRHPPHLLVTTPESLFILLTSSRFREKLAAVRWIIVDELHAIAANKRGSHLAVSLERLERLVSSRGGSPPVRIGLSATLNPIEQLADFLSGTRERDGQRQPRPCQIVRADQQRPRLDLQVLAPGPELGPIATHQHWEAMYDRIAALIGQHRTTLVFTLSRRWAERLALALQQRLGSDAVLAHHGSLARAQRFAAEQRLKRGELRAIVATSSLELGIDVGAVELVCQVDSPKSIVAAIQRIGRAGHALGQTPKGRFFALTLDDLIECAAAVQAIRAGRLEVIEIPRASLDVAAQQIVAIAAEEGEIGEGDLLALLRGAYNFRDLDRARLQALLEQMSRPLQGRIKGAGPRIFYDRQAGLVRPRRGARLVALTNAGTIAEVGNYDVVIESSQHRVGDVEEDFAQEATRGDIFALGSMPWRINGISRGRLMVEAAPGMAPTLPFWQTEAAGRSAALSDALIELRADIARRLSQPEAAMRFLIDECAMEERAAAQAIDYVRRGQGALGLLPDRQTLVAERFFDGLGGTQIVLHSPLGMKLNRGFGLALRKRLCQSFDFEIQASATDDGILLALNSRHSFPLAEIFHLLTPANVRKALTQAVLAGPMFELRLRHVANRALALVRNDKGRKVPPYLTRLRAQELITELFPAQQACLDNRPPDIEIPDHYLLTEALFEACQESTDLAGVTALLEGIARGQVRTVAVDSLAPSAFAQRLLLATDYSFLDDGERANRRSRTVQMNRALADEVLRTEEGVGEMLLPAAIEQVASEAGHLAAGRQARDSDEIFELIRAHGALERTELEPRVAGDAEALLAPMLEAGRVIERPLPHRAASVLIASEDRALFEAAYDRSEQAAGAAVAVEQARRELIRRALQCSGPIASATLARIVGFSVVETERHLIALEAGGSAFRGRFDGGENWCERFNLERIHRLTLERLRAQAEPCDDPEYIAFCLRWHHIGGEGLPPGSEGMASVLQQMAGLSFPPALWESAILPARIPDYRPEYLDLLCLSGQYVWLAEPDSEGGWPRAIKFLPRPAFSSAPAALPDDPKERAVLDALGCAGAQYLDQIAQRANLSERDTLRALWRLAAAGFASNDAFAPLRLLASTARAGRALEAEAGQHGSRYDAGVRARLRAGLGGRWTALARVPEGAPDGAIQDHALRLLHRYGVVSREITGCESGPPWSQLRVELRRLEYAGRIRAGYFVRSLSGEQYALAEAVTMLESVRAGAGRSRAEGPVALAAQDPANPIGAALAGCAVTREADNVLVFAGGLPLIGIVGRELRMLKETTPEQLASALREITRLRPRLALERIDGQPALQSSAVAALAGAGFHSDGRALIYDGLPGPLPARARALGDNRLLARRSALS